MPAVARRATFAGLAGSLVGIGLARFAYTPLIPAVVASGWFSPAEAAFIGAANLAGYLAGSLAARGAVRRLSLGAILRWSMLAATMSLVCCAAPVSLSWFLAWRFVGGVAGGFIMVLAAPAILAIVPTGHRGRAGGLIFTGIGIGIAASGLLVPALLGLGLPAAWLGLGGIAAILSLASWREWPAAPPQAPAARVRIGGPVLAIIAIYGFDAVGVVPHMIFLVDYVARGLHRGLAAGAVCWIAFGAVAIMGPGIAGFAADRIGFRPTLRWVLVANCCAVALPLITVNPAALWASATVAGAFTPGIVPLALGCIHVLLPPGGEAARSAWRAATIAWAIGQAAAAQAFSYIFASTGAYSVLFMLGTAALIAALILDLASAPRLRPRRHTV